MNQTINLAYGQGNTLVLVAELIASELGVEPDMTIAPSLLGEVTHYVADLSKAVTCWATTRKCPSTRAFRARSPGSASIAKPIPRRISRPTTRAIRLAGRRSQPIRSSVLAIFGPTASGKSAVAEAIAERSRPSFVSADSMQVYRGLPILTNQDARARLVGIWAARPPGNRRRVPGTGARGDRRDRRRRPNAVVVGGSGLWFQAALTDVRLRRTCLRTRGRAGSALRPAWRGDRAQPAAGSRSPCRSAVHPNDRKRVVRALELWQAGGTLVPEEPCLERRAAPADPRRRPRGPRETLAARIAPYGSDVRAGRGGRGAGGGDVVPQVLGLDARTLPRAEAIAELERATPALRRLPAQVDAPHPRHRHDRRGPARGRGGGCDSRSGTHSVTATCSSSGGNPARLRHGTQARDVRYGIGSDGVLELAPRGRRPRS